MKSEVSDFDNRILDRCRKAEEKQVRAIEKPEDCSHFTWFYDF